MAQHGGKREGSGRKSKAEEAKLIERLSPLDELAFRELKKGMEAGDYSFIKMFFEYRFGRPKDTVDLNVPDGINIVFKRAND